MKPAVPKPQRCAIYTRKSTEHNLDANEPQPPNRVFSPQKWIKTKGCLAGINGAIRNYFNMLPMMPGGAEIKQKLIGATQLRPEDFEYRWSAD
jgi:hypothetical protein